jgi:hypothetical protein
MITPARIGELLQRKPFRPIKFFLSDGSHHDVPHPEFAWVFGGRLFIGESANGSADAGGRLKELAVLHVTRVEEIKPHKPKK